MKSLLRSYSKIGTFLLLLFGVLAHGALGQSLRIDRPLASHVVVPQSRAFSMNRGSSLQITAVHVDAKIVEQAATTTMDIMMQNPTSSRLEAELLVPVPDGAVVQGFTFQGAGSEPTAALLPRDEARRIYNDIVSRMRDPALLEFAGFNLIRSSVFPVEPGGTQQVRLVFEHLLSADGSRIDYVLPRSESVLYDVPWKIDVRVKSKKPITTVYSPSHRLETHRFGSSDLLARVTGNASSAPGAFRLSYLLEKEEDVTASLFAYPDRKVGGGYFLLLAGLPAYSRSQDKVAIRREVTLVLDRSGSMKGDKIDQVREAAFQILAGLEEGEAFNIITYNEHVDLFSERPVSKDRASLERAWQYLKGILPRGGTNIHDALLESLRIPPARDTLPIVLFLTDGLPTMGETSEKAIRRLAVDSNPYNRRIFTFGVGVDVNTPLLDKIARETRATATFVLPKEDIEVKVGQVFRRLQGPMLASPELKVVDSHGRPATYRVRDRIPAALPDLFDGDQLVVLGTYSGEEPLFFTLAGNYLGRKRTFRFECPLSRATTRNAFVPRLWASRKIALLIDAIRESGADLAMTPSSPVTDPRIKELVDEVVRLSTEFGILTEYTAFLAREGTDLGRYDGVLAEAMDNFRGRAMFARKGTGSINQEFNMAAQRAQAHLNIKNEYLDQNLNRVAVTSVQQVNDRAFYQRGQRWVDSRIAQQDQPTEPAQVIEFGTAAFDTLLDRMVNEGRQGILSLQGEILVNVDGQNLLIKSAGSR
ncbi:MAG: VIT domain-containing protein [Planctomycetota bacterium]|jgi:Ca-activated chloride channel family protein